MQDIIIIGGGSSGLFFSLNCPKDLDKLILEKTDSLGKKILLSGGGRGNVTNIYIDPERDYFGLNKKFLYSVFHKFSNYDFIDWLSQNGINTKEENFGKVFLEDHNTSKLVHLLINKTKENNTNIKLNTNINSIIKEGDIFVIKTNNGEFQTHNLIIATGGKCFPQVGASGFAYEVAQQFGLELIKPWKGMCPIETNKDMSELAGSTAEVILQIFKENKQIFEENGSCLFTHEGISGPVVYNAVFKIAKYLRGVKINCDNDDKYLKDNFQVQIIFNINETSKRLQNYFELNEDYNSIILDLEKFGSREKSQITGGGIAVKELTPSFESRKIPGLYFLGEALDITGKTGGYNLQFARSSAFVCAQSFKNN